MYQQTPLNLLYILPQNPNALLNQTATCPIAEAVRHGRYYILRLMSVEEWAKQKGDRLARQSVALLQRLKSKRQKQEEGQQENYIEDLYFKVFGKCSPHFDKMLTSHEILAEHHRKAKTIAETKQEWENALRLNAELSDQLSRLKQCQDESGKMKALNAELNKLERAREENAALIRTLRKEKEALLNEMEQKRQQLDKSEQLNAELEELVHKMAQQIEENAHQKQAASIDNLQIQQLTAQLQDAQRNSAWALKRLEAAISEGSVAKQGLDESQRSLGAANRQVNLMRDIIAGLQLQKGSLQKQLEALKQANGNLCADIQNYKQAVHRQQVEREAQTAKMKEMLSTMAQDMARMQATLDSSNQINLKLTARNQQLQQQLLESSNREAQREEDLMCKTEQLRERLKFFKQSNEQLNNQKIDYIHSIELLAEETNNLTQQLAHKQQELTSLRDYSSNQLSALKQQRQQLKGKLNEAVNNYQTLLQLRSRQSEQHTKQVQRIQQSYSNLEISSLIEFQSLGEQKARFEKAMAKSAQEQKQLQNKIKEQYQRIQRLQLEKHHQQQALSQKTKQFAAQISALSSELEQLKQRSALSKQERDHLSQQKIALLQQKEEMSQANDKLRAEVSEKKLKLHRNQEKICELNQIINHYQQNPHHSPILKPQNKNSQDVHTEEKAQPKCNKHISTINQLSTELTNAYAMIQQLQQTISQLKAKPEDKKEKGSPQRKERGRSIKKIAGIFGF